MSKLKFLALVIVVALVTAFVTHWVIGDWMYHHVGITDWNGKIYIT